LRIFAIQIWIEFMRQELQLMLAPELAEKQELLTKQVADKLVISPSRITQLRTVRKSIDARSFIPKVNLTVEVYWDEPAPVHEKPVFEYHSVEGKMPVLIIGAGPAGLFCCPETDRIRFKTNYFGTGQKCPRPQSGYCPTEP